MMTKGVFRVQGMLAVFRVASLLRSLRVPRKSPKVHWKHALCLGRMIDDDEGSFERKRH